MYVLFYLQVLVILTRIQEDIIKMYIGPHVKYLLFLLYFN